MLLLLNNFKTLLFVISTNYSVIPVNPLYQNLCLSIRLRTLLLLKIEVKNLIRDQKSAIKEERENTFKLFVEESSHIPWPYSTTKIFESFILLIHRKIAMYFSSNTYITLMGFGFLEANTAKLQNTRPLWSVSLTCVGRLWRSRHNTVDAILIQWHVNEWPGILQLLRQRPNSIKLRVN